MDRPNCDSVIAYAPVGDEPDPSVLGFGHPSYIIPPKGDTDIAAAVAAAKERVHGKVCVLVPGRAFDRTGTRHGRGGGWYDRFLARAPRDWITIGVTTPDRLSTTPLVREPHDIPVAWLAILSGAMVEWFFALD